MTKTQAMAATARAPRARILVVDDDPDLRRLLTLALETAGGCAVHAADGAGAALAAIDAAAEPFDAVFLDIQMPGTTGIQLCPIIRTTPGYGTVPIIMLTAMTQHPHLHEAFARGADDYVTKPFEFDEIRRVFARQTPGRRIRFGGASVPARGETEAIWALEDAAPIFGLERCVGKAAFETYILQSTARYASPLTVRAVKIAQVFDLFHGLPRAEFRKLVHGVAALLSELTAQSGDIFAYFGNGVFFTSSVGPSALTLAGLSKRLEATDRFDMLTDHDQSLHIILGRDVALKGMRDADVISLLGQAIDSAETAENRRFSWNSYREWRSHRKSTGQEQSRIERSAYSRLLSDFIEDGELGWE
jgi:CheY-like chemotaxis protein